jgi:fructokinase
MLLMKPIVGIGEVLWDVYPDREVAGGAPFNFAFHCHNLGHPAAIISRVGADERGVRLRQRIRELGLSDEFVQTDHDHPTGTAGVFRTPAGQTFQITEDVAWDRLAWSEELAALSEVTGVVCFGTLAVRGETTFEAVSAFGNGPDTLRVFDVNLRQNYFSRAALEWGFARAHWVKVSEEELPRVAAVFDISAEPDALFAKFHQTLLTPGQLLIVTKGADGAELVCPERDEFICEPGVLAKPGGDTVGAGDSFTAALVCKTLEGWPLRRAARFAVRYAAKVCEFQGGTPPVDPDDIDPDSD